MQKEKNKDTLSMEELNFKLAQWCDMAEMLKDVLEGLTLRSNEIPGLHTLPSTMGILAEGLSALYWEYENLKETAEGGNEK